VEFKRKSADAGMTLLLSNAQDPFLIHAPRDEDRLLNPLRARSVDERIPAFRAPTVIAAAETQLDR
jgi:hypothetical protein